MSETPLDSQLFGHRARVHRRCHDHDGVFLAAAGGTLLLDEVAEIPLSLQAKFLRAIQEREVTPLGSTRPIPVDVRLIAATNRDMDAEVRAGRFRADLFYRLNVVHIEVPPLRARRDDLPHLVTHFLRLYSERYRVAPKRIAPDALARINSYDWPGNVRELQNAIERAFALSAADVIGIAELPPAVAGRPTRFPLERADGSLPTLAEAEARLVAAALTESDGNKNEAARRLGIDRQRLYRKIAKYGLG